MAARLDEGDVQLLRRTGLDWTTKYRTIAEAVAELSATTAYLDGELCGVLSDGRTAITLIQNAADIRNASLVFFLFDLLFLDGADLRGLLLIERKDRLKTLLADALLSVRALSSFLVFAVRHLLPWRSYQGRDLGYPGHR